MSWLRSRLVLRSVATLLVVGVASTLAPAAAARDARADALQTLLDDEAAFEAALAASHEAAPGAEAVDAFVEAYVAAAHGAVDADAVRRLIAGHAFGWAVPVADGAAFVPAPTSAPPSTAGAWAPAPPEPRPDVAPAAPAGTGDAVFVSQEAAPSVRPRAP